MPTKPMPFLSMGFRPFFLLAGLFAGLWIPLWAVAWQGLVFPGGVWPGHWWHAHEMLFGYTAAVLAGFLLTATYNWTGTPHLSGWRLAGLVVLWLAGRLVMVSTVSLPPLAVALVDLAFLPALAATIAVPMVKSGIRHNLVVVPPLLTLAIANGVIHWAVASGHSLVWTSMRDLTFGVVAIFLGLIAGRVFPMFTRNAAKGSAPKSRKWVEIAAMATLVALPILDVVPGAEVAVGVVSLMAAVVHGLRLWGWDSLKTRKVPILWVLHVGYLWLVVALLLKGLAALGLGVPEGAWLHAMGLGAIGTLTLGMMSRVALGHTGRDIKAAPLTVLAYGLLTAAALVRVAGEWMGGGLVGAVHGSTLLWSLAFLIFAAVYLPIVTRPKIVPPGLPIL